MNTPTPSSLIKIIMEEEYLDYVLVPFGLLVLGIYHLWLLYTIIHRPTRTVIGLNAFCRYQWVLHMMSEPEKKGVLAVQTIRNNLMASTLLATIAITLSSLISAVVSSSNSMTTYTIYTTKYLSVLVCFLIAFFCNMQSTRYYAHVSFLLNVPSCQCEDREEFVEYVAQHLNRACLFWSLGLRAFYFSFPLLLWIFGPIAMVSCSCLMAIILYFLDTASSSPRFLHNANLNNKKTGNICDIESAGDSVRTIWSEDFNLHSSLLGSTDINSSDIFTSAR